MAISLRTLALAQALREGEDPNAVLDAFEEQELEREERRANAVAQQALAEQGIFGLPGFQQFISPRRAAAGHIPIAPVGPGTLGGAPFQANPTEEIITGLAGIIANFMEGRRVAKERRAQRGGEAAGSSSGRKRRQQTPEETANALVTPSNDLPRLGFDLGEFQQPRLTAGFRPIRELEMFLDGGALRNILTGR